MYTPKTPILTAGPSITQLEIDYVNDAVTNGRNSNWNGYIKKFEERFAQYVGRKYAISTSCCTGSLHLALASLNIGPGDEVLVPDITRGATASAVKYTGATPIFVDVDPKTRCMSVASIKENITPYTKVIMPVYNYGNAPQMDEIVEIAKNHNLFVVEDAAPALGTIFKGKKSGSFGDFACFSFQGAKIMTTGEGGMLVTDNQELFERAYFLGDHGRNPDGSFRILEVGFKYKMTNICAALGLAQLERIDEIVNRKKEILQTYKEGLKDIPGISMNYEDENSNINAWSSSIVLNPKIIKISRDELRAKLKERLVDTRPFFPQLSKSDAYFTSDSETIRQRNIGAKLIAENGINLPSGHNLTQDELGYIIMTIKDIIK